MQKLNTLFNISYGSKLDKNKTVEVNKQPILFVSRTSKNHGIDLICEKQFSIKENPANTISVPLGGEGRLTANVQFQEYYNGQNVAILSPKVEMSLMQRIYYSLVIKENQFRYSAFGREANSTLGDILIPSIDEIPDFVTNFKGYEKISTLPSISNNDKVKEKEFLLLDLFDPLSGTYISEEDAKKCKTGNIAFVSSGRFNNGVKAKIELMGFEATIFPANCLSLAKNGSVGVCFYHETPIVCTSDVLVLKFKQKQLNVYEGLYFKVLIEQHIFRFNYGRKINADRLAEIKISVPYDSINKTIDFNYINKVMRTKVFADLI